MSRGHRWLALDADLYAKPFTDQLLDQFGWAGVGVWVAFLCACKRGRIPGQMTVLSDVETLVELGILGRRLVDDDGKEWTLEDFWGFTGRMKQTRRTRHGRVLNVRATHWGRWQDAARTSLEAERKSWSRQQKNRTTNGQTPDIPRTRTCADSDSDSDTPPTPPSGGSGRRFASNSQTQDPPRPHIPDWEPEPTGDTLGPEAVAALRAERGWTKP